MSGEIILTSYAAIQNPLWFVALLIVCSVLGFSYYFSKMLRPRFGRERLSSSEKIAASSIVLFGEAAASFFFMIYGFTPVQSLYWGALPPMEELLRGIYCYLILATPILIYALVLAWGRASRL
jgi:hypothetical protein